MGALKTAGIAVMPQSFYSGVLEEAERLDIGLDNDTLKTIDDEIALLRVKIKST